MFNNSKTKVKYFIDAYSSNLLRTIPKGIFPDIQSVNNKIGCPSVSSANDRLFVINSFLDVDIEFGYKDNKPYYKYELNNKHPFREDMHRFMSDTIGCHYEKGIVHLQIISPYYLVTDDKELDIYTLNPNNEMENCTYVSGSFKPYYWIRNFNSTYLLTNHDKPATVKLRINKPLLSFVANKKLDIEFFYPSEKVLNYHSQSSAVINYRNNLSDVYKTIFNRRPKKLLD